MSSLIAAPELMAVAATDLAAIGSMLRAAHEAAAPRTLGVLPAASDEVSAGIAHLFSEHAQEYQGLAGHVGTFHDRFVQQLSGSATAYASGEAANIVFLQSLEAFATSVSRAISGAIDGTINQFVDFVSYLLSLAFRPIFYALLDPILDLYTWVVLLALYAALYGALTGA
ncbi:PE family protein [Mycobacterium asiaticum]|uniref:PE family protein n=1 Tax=Mycobacterium asiaticum TaxID=1790 RepID=UPI00068489C4|nr:PE family protein [Mycobacterium asiaticum]ORA15511.1 PE family protein [Mycobacterium asiaticum DSM 44297]